MANNVQPNYPGDVIEWIADRNFSVEEKSLSNAAAMTFVSGAVCGPSSADAGTQAILLADGIPTPDGADADSIYIGPKVTTVIGVAQTGPFLMRGPAVVKSDGLNYAAATSVPAVDAILRGLDIQVLKNAPNVGPTA